MLRRINIGTGIMAAPMSYEIDGTQYVAVAAGFGGAFNSYFLPGWAARDRENNPRLIVFKLDGAPVTLAPLRTATPLLPAPAKFRGTPAQVARGGALFGTNCARCHGDSTGSGGYPNLWTMMPETHDAFDAIVLDGSFAYAGMAAFGDVLSKGDVRDIHAYLAEPVAPEPATPPKRIH